MRSRQACRSLWSGVPILILGLVVGGVVVGGGTRLAGAEPMGQTGRPPELVMPHQGQVRLRVERGNTTAAHRVWVRVDDGCLTVRRKW